MQVLLCITLYITGLGLLFTTTDISAREEKFAAFIGSTDKNTVTHNISSRIALFDESIEWATSRAATDKIIEEIASYGISLYIPCVWHGRGTYYPSLIAKPDSRLISRIESGDDPLAYLLEKAREKGIAVHPWITVVKREDDLRKSYFLEGTPNGAYDIHVPEFRRFISDLVVEMANKYKVEGINLDYIRSMGLCKSLACITSYRHYTGQNLEADLKLRYVPWIKKRIGEWNSIAIKDILVRIRSRINDSVIVSVDAHPLESYTELQGQFPIQWVNEGLIDRIYDMRYGAKIDFDKIQAIQVKLIEPDALWILISNAEKMGKNWEPRKSETILTQLSTLSGRWPNIGLGIWHRPRITAEQANLYHLLWNKQ